MDRLKSTLSSKKVQNILKLTFSILLVVLIIYIIYVIFMKYRHDKVTIVPGVRRITETEKDSIQPFTNSTYMFWMFIENWTNQDYKLIFNHDKSLLVFLDKNVNTLVVMYKSQSCDTPSSLEVPNMPLQSWVHITICKWNRTIDIYINGRLATSHVRFEAPVTVQNPTEIVVGIEDPSNSNDGDEMTVNQYIDAIKCATPCTSDVLDKCHANQVTSDGQSVHNQYYPQSHKEGIIPPDITTGPFYSKRYDLYTDNSYIGRWNKDFLSRTRGSSSSFDGYIADFFFFEKALTQRHIERIFKWGPDLKTREKPTDTNKNCKGFKTPGYLWGYYNWE